MPIRTVAIRPRQALAALAESVRAIKAGEPLAPVTVVVPTNATGVTARRYLGAHGGVAAVDMLTLYRVAEVLGGPLLAEAGRAPVSTPVIDLAVRAALRERPGAFRAVADHPSTTVALRDLHREIRQAGPHAASALAEASARGREAANISTQVTHRLGGWYDELDLVESAIASLAASPPPPQLARVVVFLPHALRGGERRLLRALGEHASVELLVAHVGDAAVDGELAVVCAQLGAPLAGATPAAVVADERVELVSATDADEEVRHAVRTLVDAARAGIAFSRIAVLWPLDLPYARLVEHHLGAAGIEWNGRPGTTFAERVAPRFVLDLLDVDRRGLRRRELFDLLADLPISGPEGRANVHRWERASRDAGVFGDDDWEPRLTRYAHRRRTLDHEAGFDTSRRADDAEQLARFVADLRRDLGRRSAARTWAEWTEWCERQIARRLGTGYLHGLELPEQIAWQHTNRVLDRLRSLDVVSGPVTRSEFRSVFAAEFDVAPGRQGRIGTGVTIGSVSAAVGLDLDLAVVLGATEGAMPAAPDSGPLIGDHERERAGLPSSQSVALRLHRQLRSVVDAAGHTVITRPRGDLRATTVRQPSRWLPAMGLTDETPLPSHHAALVANQFPPHAGEHRLRERLVAAAPAPLAAGAPTVAGDPVLSSALALRAGRRRETITVFDGDLSSVPLAHFDRPVAPTQIEAWVACPHAYFMRFLLGVQPVDEPGDVMEISPADRGNLLHEALDRFHREVIAGELPQPAGGWSAAHRARLRALFDELADEYESVGRTGRDASWAVERADLRADLLAWLDHDSAQVAAHGSTVVSSEGRFGREGGVLIPLADGRSIAVHGAIDRVDRTASGELLVVDHKTGKLDPYRHITEADPTAGATRFQLPAYAVGAAALAGVTGDVPVRAEYSFFGRGSYRRIGYRFTPEVWRQVATELATVVAGIESGLFPARADEPGFQLWVSCHYCQPDALGTAERYPEWARKRNDPRGAAWFGEPLDADDVSEDRDD